MGRPRISIISQMLTFKVKLYFELELQDEVGDELHEEEEEENDLLDLLLGDFDEEEEEEIAANTMTLG